jgi:hypothetical protein
VPAERGQDQGEHDHDAPHDHPHRTQRRAAVPLLVALALAGTTAGRAPPPPHPPRRRPAPPAGQTTDLGFLTRVTRTTLTSRPGRSCSPGAAAKAEQRRRVASTPPPDVSVQNDNRLLRTRAVAPGVDGPRLAGADGDARPPAR